MFQKIKLEIKTPMPFFLALKQQNKLTKISLLYLVTLTHTDQQALSFSFVYKRVKIHFWRFKKSLYISEEKIFFGP